MDLVKAVPTEGIEPEWFYGLLRFSEFSKAVREEATGATVLHLKPKHIENREAVVPPARDRRIFAEHFGATLQQIDNLELQSASCEKARDLLPAPLAERRDRGLMCANGTIRGTSRSWP